MFKSISKLFSKTDDQASPSLTSATTVTGKSFMGKLKSVFDQAGGDDFELDDIIDDIEELLIKADVGLDIAVEITDKLRKQKHQLKTQDEILAFLKNEFAQILAPFADANLLSFTLDELNIYLVVGVNGAGKTTFIGKLAHLFMQAGQRVVIGAGDTFRAAATEQLEIWADRAGALFIGGKPNADPASVIYDALKVARDEEATVLLLDTAGRLQNKHNLMEELRKIKKVIDKEMEQGSSHLESLLVLDATTGQNALKQAEVFRECVDLTGVVLTKLDGSAKGGVILSIAKEFKLPVKMVGVGEGIDDLKPFEPTEYLDALFNAE